MECPTKLFYTKKKEEYADRQIGDTFLEALAEGGYQVGELAKYLICDQPTIDNVTVETLDYEKSLQETQQRIDSSGNCVIAEPAFAYEHYFIRVDLFKKNGNEIDLYEVKSKSWNQGNNRDDVNDIMIKTPSRGKHKGKRVFNNDWYYFTFYKCDVSI